MRHALSEDQDVAGPRAHPVDPERFAHARLVATRKQGWVVFYRLAPDFPEPLLDHCLRRRVALPRTDTGMTEPAEDSGNRPTSGRA